MPATRESEVSILGVPIRDLGVLPGVVAKVNQLAADPEATSDQVAVLIVRDASLTTMVLRLINSAHFGLRQEVRSIPRAVAYLGVPEIRNLVVSSALVESFRFDHGVVDPRSVWEHSLGCAIGAKQLGDLVPTVDGDTAYLGGLLHDLGRIAMLSKFRDVYREVANLCERGLALMRSAEESSFGVSHERAGALLARAWGFPEPVQNTILHHHSPDTAKEHGPLVAVVTIVNAICHQQGLSFGFTFDDELAPSEKERAWKLLAPRDLIPEGRPRIRGTTAG